LKEQLQTLWQTKTVMSMEATLETWCQLADETDMTYIKKFAKSLRRHKVGICNYAKYNLTTARIEAGNVGIGLIRKRARGILDTDYFMLKIRQLSVPEEKSIFYKKVAWATS
jgi:transposase